MPARLRHHPARITPPIRARPTLNRPCPLEGTCGYSGRMRVLVRDALLSAGTGLLVLALTYGFEKLEIGARLAIALAIALLSLVVAHLVSRPRPQEGSLKFIHGIKARSIDIDGATARPADGSREFITDLTAEGDISIRNVSDEGNR